MLESGRVAAESVAQESRDPADRGDADPRHIVNATIREILLQQAYDLPPIDQRLELRRRT